MQAYVKDTLTRDEMKMTEGFIENNWAHILQ